MQTGDTYIVSKYRNLSDCCHDVSKQKINNLLFVLMQNIFVNCVDILIYCHESNELTFLKPDKCSKITVQSTLGFTIFSSGSLSLLDGIDLQNWAFLDN